MNIPDSERCTQKSRETRGVGIVISMLSAGYAKSFLLWNLTQIAVLLVEVCRYYACEQSDELSEGHLEPAA